MARVGALALLAATTAALVAASPPARAGGADPVYVRSEVKDLPSRTVRAAVARCPAQTSVTGGGLEIQGANTATGIHSSYPIDGNDADTKPDDGWRGVANSRSAGDKKMQAIAVCSRSGRFVYPTGGGSAPSGETSASVNCPTGWRSAGGGLSLAGTSPVVGIGGTRPDGPLAPISRYWLADANNGTGSSVGAKIFAACAETGRYRYYAAEPVTIPVFSQGYAVAECPPGTKVTGGGASSEAGGTADELADSEPFGMAPVDKWFAAMNNNSGVPLDFAAYVVCRG